MIKKRTTAAIFTILCLATPTFAQLQLPTGTYTKKMAASHFKIRTPITTTGVRGYRILFSEEAVRGELGSVRPDSLQAERSMMLGNDQIVIRSDDVSPQFFVSGSHDTYLVLNGIIFRIVKLSSDNGLIDKLNRAALLEASHKSMKAIRAYRAILFETNTVLPSNIGASGLAVRLALLEAHVLDFDSARRSLLWGTSADPEDIDAWLLLGAIEIRLDNHSAAQQAIEKALALDPSLPEAHFMLMRIMAQQGDHEAASYEIKTALRLAEEQNFHKEDLQLYRQYRDRYK